MPKRKYPSYKRRFPIKKYVRRFRRAYVRRPGVTLRAAKQYGRKVEVKTVDTVCTMEMDNNSPVANCMQLLNTIPTGATPTSRIGKKVCLKAVQIRGNVTSRSATANVHASLLLVWIKTPNQAATLPPVQDILMVQSSNALTNRDNASKFKIVRRWDFNVTGNSTTPATGKEIQYVEEYVSFKKDKYISQWTNASTAGTIGEFEKGALILLTVSDTANGATTTPDFLGNVRVYFDDV